MNLRRRHKIQAEVNAASMNDNMFFLMLFFLIASLVINPNVIRVQNPRSESGETFSKETVNITLTEDLQLYLDKIPVTVGMLDSMLQNYPRRNRSEEHTSELQSLMRHSYAVFCLKKKTKPTKLIQLQKEIER